MKEIAHKGRVVSVNADVTEVEILRSSACSSCEARGLCGTGGEKSAVVAVPTDAFAIHEVGDEVEVCLKRSMGMKAVWICYVIPLIVLLAVMSALTLLKVGELVCALSGLGATAAYYLAIYLLRDRIDKGFIFYIK